MVGEYDEQQGRIAFIYSIYTHTFRTLSIFLYTHSNEQLDERFKVNESNKLITKLTIHLTITFWNKLLVGVLWTGLQPDSIHRSLDNRRRKHSDRSCKLLPRFSHSFRFARRCLPSPQLQSRSKGGLIKGINWNFNGKLNSHD